MQNVVTFIGACHTPPNVCLVTEFCARGSLDHLLHKSGIQVRPPWPSLPVHLTRHPPWRDACLATSSTLRTGGARQQQKTLFFLHAWGEWPGPEAVPERLLALGGGLALNSSAGA